MTTNYAPKHMKSAEPKTEPISEWEKAWRAAYVAECCTVGTQFHEKAKALRAEVERCMTTTKPTKAPKAKPAKAKAAAPANWWDEWFAQPWVKATRATASSSIVKMHCEGGHGAELRAAGWQYSKKGMPIGGGKRVAGFWWASKDAAKAKERGERYLANKAARAEQAAAC